MAKTDFRPESSVTMSDRKETNMAKKKTEFPKQLHVKLNDDGDAKWPVAYDSEASLFRDAVDGQRVGVYQLVQVGKLRMVLDLVS